MLHRQGRSWTLSKRFLLSSLVVSVWTSTCGMKSIASAAIIADPKVSSRTCFESLFGPPPGHFIETTHGTTHYILEGKKENPLVVLQHGIGGDVLRLDRVANDLLTNGYQVLRYDMYDRGYSESDPNRYPIHRMGVHPLKFTADVYIQQFEDVLNSAVFNTQDSSSKEKEKKDNDNFFHVGHSLGGFVGIAYAAKYPEQVNGLVLIDAACLPVKKPLIAKISNWPIWVTLLRLHLVRKHFKSLVKGV